MYSLEIVQSAVQKALLRRGFEFPRAGDRSKNSTIARVMAFDAIHSLTGMSVTGSAVSVNASTASGKSLKERADNYVTAEDRILWISEVRSLIEQGMAK